MVVHNTQYANSKTVADYYAAVRGLDTAHVQGYDFGTADIITSPTNRNAFRNGVLTQIRDYIQANGIEGVAVSINCPLRYEFDETISPDYDGEASFCRVIGGADRIVTLGGNTQPFNQMNIMGGTATYWPPGSTNGKFWVTQRLQIYPTFPAYCYDYRVNGKIPINDGAGPIAYTYVPCGRIGYHVGMGSDDAALAMRCIDDAVWFEQNGNPAAETMLFGFSSRAGTIMWGNVWQAYHYLTGRINCETYDGNFNNSSGSKYSTHAWGFEKPAITIANQATWLQGGGPTKILWGWLGAGFENNGAAYLPSVSFRRGAWMFEATSSNVSGISLTAGACAAVCPVQEPYTDGLPEISGLTWLLLHGFSLEEATICSTLTSTYGGRSIEVWGDPFYSPLNKVILGKTLAAGMSASGHG